MTITKYEGHTEGPWRIVKPHHANETGHIWCIESATEIDYPPDIYTKIAHICVIHNEDDDSINAQLIADAPDLLIEVKRLQKALDIEQQIVQAFYEYRDDCCFDHCEAWMLEKGHRVIVNGQSEWKNEAE
tara:strand:+ start:696 stop:1085 length:390 start_codon:yes stop_codon:yes gene_type:complete